MASVFARLRLGAFGLAVALSLAAAATPARADQAPVAQVCASLLPGFMHCDAEVALASHAEAHKSSVGPSGYGPADLQSAYGLTEVAAAYGSDQTVAVVDAYDAPNAERDLAVYRAQYGLPPCTSASGCFRKVNQNGGTTPPAPDAGWASEIALDLDMVSAVCPHCRILLVEANTNSMSDLAAAVDTAAAAGATQISNSYGAPELNVPASALEPHYRHPGIAVTVASGDSGYGVEYPASSAYVTAVGGTSLLRSATPRGWSETAWSGSGSGCSAVIPKPAWQTDTSCATRSVADVSAVADPNTGVAVYDSGDSGWQVYGGTSAAAPIVAAAYALTGASAASDFGSYAYQNPGYFNDVTSGNNAASCTVLYLCVAGVGFDGPTGMGTPNSAHPTGAPPPIPESGATSGTSGESGSSSAGPITGSTSIPPQRSKTLAPLRSSVAVSAAAVAASRRGVVAIRVSCARGRPACKGVFTLQARIRHGALRTLARRSYSLRPGKSVLLKVKLSRRYRRLLERTRRMRAYGTVRDSDGTKAQAALVLRARVSRS